MGGPHVEAQSQSVSPQAPQIDPVSPAAHRLMVTATGNIRFRYPPHQIDGTADQAHYDSATQQWVLSGHVRLRQQGTTIVGERVACRLDTGQCHVLKPAMPIPIP